MAVGERLTAAVISVMLASGRAVEAWAAYRSRHDLSAWPSSSTRSARCGPSPRAARAAMAQVRRAYAVLTGEIWPHENVEETDLYPAVNRLPGGNDPAAARSWAHAEISYQIAWLGRLIAEIGDRAPDGADLRTTLYGLYAILRLHTAQEDEAYLSLGDEETVPDGR